MARHRSGTIQPGTHGLRVRVTVDAPERGPGATKREWWDLGTFDPRVAERKRDQLVAALAEGKRPGKETVVGVGTVESYGATWEAERRSLGVVSARDESGNLKNHVYPAIMDDKSRFGSIKLTDVRPPHIKAVLMRAVREGLSKTTVGHIRAAMRLIFKSAWQAELIPENPVLKVPVPRMREVKKTRVILTDDEIIRLVSCEDVDLELRVVSVCARCEGGMRSGDVNSWEWSMIDTVNFAKCFVPREKNGVPQALPIPEVLRPFLREWWEAHGKPVSGPVFPVRKGKTEGGFKAKRGTTYAKRLRRGLRQAGVVRHTCTRPLHAPAPRAKDPCCPAFASDPLYNETAFTLQVDFHSFRRAYNTGLADADVNVQKAMVLAGHSDTRTHMRYVGRSAAMTQIPEAALPRLVHAGAPRVELSRAVDDSIENSSKTSRATLDSNQWPTASEGGYRTTNTANASGIAGEEHDRICSEATADFAVPRNESSSIVPARAAGATSWRGGLAGPERAREDGLADLIRDGVALALLGGGVEAPALERDMERLLGRGFDLLTAAGGSR